MSLPPAGHTSSYLCLYSSPAERAYEISHSGPASRPEERENSIFVAALKEHVQKGTLDTRIDRLLTEAAEGRCGPKHYRDCVINLQNETLTIYHLMQSIGFISINHQTPPVNLATYIV